MTLLACSALVWLFFTWQVMCLQPLTSAGWFHRNHFMEYWAASQLHLAGNNPYSPELLLTLQKSVGWNEAAPIMMWNPPWTLPFVMPFGIASYPLGQILWLIFRFAIVLFCVHWTWSFYGGPGRRYWIAWLLAFTFAPTLIALVSGQIGPLILLGLVGFLHFEKRKQPWLAGLFLLLISIKPHLLYLVWEALLLWVINTRRWSILASSCVAGILATVMALIFNPAVLGQYLDALVNQPPPAIAIRDWASPTLGGLLRFLLDLERLWLQFVPPVIGSLWFLLYWRKHRETWSWAQQLPLLILVSLTTTAYGWTFDQIVILPALMQAAAQVRAGPRIVQFIGMTLAYVAINTTALSLNALGVNEFWFFWMAPAWLAIYIPFAKRNKS